MYELFDVQVLIKEYRTGVITSLIAGFITFLIMKSNNFIKYLREKKSYTEYVGNYYIYSFSSTGEDLITTTEIKIKYGYTRLIVTANQNNVYEYTGKITIEDTNIYIDLFGKNHKERMLIIFHSPLHGKIKTLLGSFNAITVVSDPFSSVCLLSDKSLTSFEIREKFKDFSFTPENSRFIVDKKNSLYFDNLEEEQKDNKLK